MHLHSTLLAVSKPRILRAVLLRRCACLGVLNAPFRLFFLLIHVGDPAFVLNYNEIERLQHQ